MSDSEPLLRLDNIVKNYGAIEALRGISFDIGRGEVVTVGDRFGVRMTELVNPDKRV